jgi:putative transposase
MARIARIVVPHVPHHVTQRGNRRQDVFFGDADYEAYLALLAEHTRREDVAVWAWCLMPNHVHLLLVPSSEDGLRAALGEAHRRYSQAVNRRQDWRGFLWQGRFASCPTDEAHSYAAARYIELNPVRAGLAATPEAWPWSSARAHLTGKEDGVTAIDGLGIPPRDWADFLGLGLDDETRETIRAGERTGRPLGDAGFVALLEEATGRVLARQKPGPKCLSEDILNRRNRL